MLDKKALRKFADHNPAPIIPPSHGLLHTSQVDHIVRTAVRIIGRRRTLVLYVYDRAKTTGGDPAPVWTMFQAGGDYVTLARREDGSNHWREAAFERLDHGYRFKEKCAFYSARDEQRVCDFFHDHEDGGIAALARAQKDILDRRARERQLRRERRTIDRMRPLHALPRGLPAWIRREVMPAYFRCRHTSVRKPVTGTCTSCGKEFTVPGAAHNGRIACPRCGRELTVKSVGKAGRYYDRDTVQVVEKTGNDEVAVRLVKVYYNYGRDRLMPETRVYENACVFVRRGPDGKAVAEPYYFSSGKGELTHWMPGERPVFPYCSNFEASTYGHVYCRNLPEVLAGTPWEYCPATAFYEHFREPMQLVPFLRAHLGHPKLEHLVKVGFYELASDLAYGRVRHGTLDEAQDRTHRLLGVDAGDVAFLRTLDVDANGLLAFRECADARGRQKLFLWRREHDVSRDVAQCLERMTPHKFMKYVERQYPALCEKKERYGGQRYRDMQAVVTEYRDYLDMCAKLDYDMCNGFVLYPRDLQKAHDRAARRVKIKADAQMRRDFKAAMEAISGRLDYEADGMKFLLPATPEELAAEGNALHHCVGSYADRVAKHQCVILFLRRCEDPDTPFYTVEVRGREVIQVQGKYHCDPTPEVEAFMDRWERQVLQAA